MTNCIIYSNKGKYGMDRFLYHSFNYETSLKKLSTTKLRSVGEIQISVDIFYHVKMYTS